MFLQQSSDSELIKNHKTVFDGGSYFITHDFWVFSDPVAYSDLSIA